MDFKSTVCFLALALILKSGFLLATILKCESPQYIVLGTEGIVECSFPAEFKAIVWYDSSNIEQAQVTRLEKQQNGILKASGDGYESGGYDILLNGSLIIRSVTIHHERSFKVLLVDKESSVSQKDISLVTVVRSRQSVPTVSTCETGILCLTSSLKSDDLICTFNKARPAVSLSWYQYVGERTEAVDAQTNITIDGQFTFTSSLAVNVSRFIDNPLTILSCRASGPALSLEQEEAKVVVYNTDTNNKRNHYVNMLEKSVAMNTRLEIPCTEHRKPNTFVWSFTKRNVTTILAYAALGEMKLNDYANYTLSILQDGTITFKDVNYLLEGVLTCTFLESGEYSFSMIRVKVVETTSKFKLCGKSSMKLPEMTVIATNNDKKYKFLCVGVTTGNEKLTVQYQSYRTSKYVIWTMVVLLSVVLGACLIVFCIRNQKLRRRKIDAIYMCKEVADALLNCPFVFESDPSLFGQDAIDVLRIISKEAVENKRRKDKAAAAGASFSIMGGATAVFGVFLLPITLGGSIPLILGGTALSVTGAGVSTGFAIDKSIKDTERFKRAKPSFELYVKIQKNLAVSIAHIADAFELIELYVNNRKDMSDDILDTIESKMRALLSEIRILQDDTRITAQAKIEKVMKFSKQLVEILLEEVEESKDIRLNIFAEGKKAVDRTEERVFDMLPDIVLKLLSYGSMNTQIFTFYSLIHNLYAPNFIPKTTDGIKFSTLFGFGNPVLKGAAAAGGMGAQMLNVGDDIAKVGTNVAQLAKGVAVAGLVLGFVGIAVDIAFLGKAIYDIKKDKTEELPKALDDAANVMEKMNEIIRKGVQPDAAAKSQCCVN
ncbi:hypothetical protein HOLleu_09374 [Holothuria leucospilota]|uniref:Ig-like domain-containing protein n=1 Tax=Holothuria leucospilota TaxID=206669 RepID=A0A9Q1CBE6_HOLLE|nr:hypothetical protein HOLleu_09374 [Holothuria leucospilota]